MRTSLINRKRRCLETARGALYCGEFGAYPPVSPLDSRGRWFHDFASVLKESGVGYAVWGWDDGFGFGRRYENGNPVLDPVPIDALSLEKQSRTEEISEGRRG